MPRKTFQKAIKFRCADRSHPGNGRVLCEILDEDDLFIDMRWRRGDGSLPDPTRPEVGFEEVGDAYRFRCPCGARYRVEPKALMEASRTAVERGDRSLVAGRDVGERLL